MVDIRRAHSRQVMMELLAKQTYALRATQLCPQIQVITMQK
jgi:hypothetical protein